MDQAQATTDQAETGRDWARLATRGAIALGLGAVAVAAIASIGSGQGAWHFRHGFTVLRYAFYAALAGVLLGLVGLALARRGRKTSLMLANLAAIVVALGFILYVGNLVRTAKAVPAIHDASTNLDDMPQFSALKVREDNLESVPDDGRRELAAMLPEARWKAIHREAYGDLRTVQLAAAVPDVIRKAERLVKARGWEIAKVDTAAGMLEATATSTFYRFKDDVVVRARPAPGGGSLVDMRSISRVGGSDVGMNAKRVHEFLGDLKG